MFMRKKQENEKNFSGAYFSRKGRAYTYLRALFIKKACLLRENML
jgi:hypothetical protein